MKRIVCLFLVFSSGAAFAANPPDKPYGNPAAKQGGTFYMALAKEPNTLNPFTSSDAYSSMVEGYILESLLGRHPDTFDWVPGLAEKWEVSKDGKQYTFTLRPGLKFSDGKALTADDVKFSFEAIMNEAYGAAALRPYYEGLEKVDVLDERTVRFTAKEKYFRNFESAAGLAVLPKHIYGDPEKARKLNNTVVGSGAYMMDSYDRGNRIVLKRNPEWWGKGVALYKGTNNFDKIWFRFQSQDNILLEMLKKGDIDYIDDLTVNPELYTQKATGPEWGKAVLKEKVENSTPRPYNYVAWNQKSPIFQDKNVRVAMTYLMNRQFMIEKFRFGMSLPATGPWHYSSEYASKRVKPIPFDPKKAGELLAKAGWADTDKDGILDKMIDGKKVNFTFTLIFAAPDREKYLTIYKEDLKKAGIQLDLKLVEWNALEKLKQERKFDAISMGWGNGPIDIDPKQIWHSASDTQYGSNYIGYHNAEVDGLIDQARGELNKQKRVKILQKVYELIAADAPYTFMFNDKYVLYMHTARVKLVKPTYKFSTGLDTWSLQ